MQFGPFALDPSRSSLMRDGKLVSIGQHGFALLTVLAEAAGTTVSRELLMARAWPGTIVEDSNLTVQIATLRKALGPAPDGGDFITTVPRRGYRLAIASDDALLNAGPVRPALAVLPFSNLSGDPEQEYFADGVVEDIITALSRFKLFSLVARNSSFVYKGRAVDVRQVGQELDARYVLETMNTFRMF